MATSTLTQMKVYEDSFFGGMYETLQQNVDGFNAASNGAITLRTQLSLGRFQEESFFQLPAGLIADRDPTNVSDAGVVGLGQGEFVRPKVNKRIGPIENTFDSFKKIGTSVETMAFVAGGQTAPAIQAAYLNSGLAGLVGSYKAASLADLTFNATGESTATMTPSHLIKGMSKFGDQSQRIALWVMHSKVYFDLMNQQVTDKLLEVSAGVLYGGSPATFGKPVFVTDAPALYDAGASTSGDEAFYTFGLVQGAIDVMESEERSMIIEPVTGKQNLIMRMQGEFAYNVGVKGLTWNTATSNPTDAQLATGTNWSLAASSIKSAAGVRIVTR